MPTTRLKNAVYRAMLPFCAPDCGRHPIAGMSGHDLTTLSSFEHLIRKHHILGSATLISSGGESSLVITSSDSPARSAVPDTFFRVASITKMATAALALRLSDLGLLQLDRPVSLLFPDSIVRDALNGITLRHLLSHMSGIVDPPGLEASLEAGIPFSDILPAARQYQPGHSFHYSNLGFGLIGSVMEQVLSKPVGAVFSEYLFSLLNMNATLEGCLLPPDKIMPVIRILPYRKNNEIVLTRLGSVPLTEPDPVRHYGHTAGSLYTDIHSLYILLQMLMINQNHFLSDKTLFDMKRKHSEYGRLSPTLSYGLGLLRIEDRRLSDNVIYGHQGFAYGCADGAFWEERSGRVMITLNGGCSEARVGRLGLANRDLLFWAFRKELPLW